MNCRVCERGMAHGVTLYRENKPGEMPAVWICAEDMTKPVDPELQRIVDALESAELTEGTAEGYPTGAARNQ